LPGGRGRRKEGGKARFNGEENLIEQGESGRDKEHFGRSAELGSAASGEQCGVLLEDKNVCAFLTKKEGALSTRTGTEEEGESRKRRTLRIG